MKKLIPVIFVLFAIVLAFFVFSKNLFVEELESSRSRVVVPVVDSEGNNSENKYSDVVANTSFLSLSNDETLISTVEVDIDDDGLEDQINVIKDIAGPNLKVVVGVYNSSTSSYNRSFTIDTEISQVRTFSCTSLDVVGNHKNALIYQGMTDNGHFIMKIYSAEKKSSNGDFKMKLIGDFDSEGTIFIQQNPRSEAYELSQANGESFPIWIYTSETQSNSNTARLDQIQTMYDWSPLEEKYVEIRTIRVPGSSIAAKEFAKIQDGTVSSFGRFLDGLWYKVDGTDNKRFIFFDYQNEEIVFQFQDTEEVYSWLKSNLRRNGIYFSSVNKSIENLQRRFDISLVSIDEIRIKIQDDVRMLIGEENLWDGSYRKVVKKQNSNVNRENISEYIEKLVKVVKWESSDGTKIEFSNNEYVVNGEHLQDKGRFTQIDIFEKTFIQFRSESGTQFFSGEYLPTSTVDEKGETISLQKFSVSPEGFYKEQSSPIVLKKYVELSNENVVAKTETTQKEEEGDFQAQESVSQVVLAKNAKKDLPIPKASVRISPRYFSPDGDGIGDDLNVFLNVESEAKIKNWSFVVKNPEGKKDFWSKTGKSTVDSKITWDGKSSKGELVQSATDYPYILTIEDENGTKCVEEGFVQVDILVINEDGRYKIQVPSIIFRSDNADFKSDYDVRNDPNWDKESRGLTQKTIENNIRVLGRVAEILKKFQDYNVRIEGNANNMTGTAKEEEEVRLLSEQRAKFVMNWLVRDGISSSRLSAQGNGSKYPLAKARDAENRWKNRRVEFILIK